MHILGISAFYHDAAAAILKDGVILAAAEEERFTRKKHDFSFPKNAIAYCLKEAGIEGKNLDYVVYYEKPFVKFERIIQTYLGTWPRSFGTFLKAMPIWLKQKLWIPELIKKEIGYKGDVYFSEHHLSHAASTYLLSPFEEAAIFTTDAVGEWTTTAMGYGKGAEMHLTGGVNFPHSLGLLYSTFTAFLGFEVNDGEYKVMGLAPYGRPEYVDKIYRLVDVKDDGSFFLDMSYFAYQRSFVSFSRKFIREFGPPRKPESEMTLYYANLAASIQQVLEEIMLKIANRLSEETKMENLCMAGGVALNCTANGRIFHETPFKKIFIQPAAGDSGGALGAAAYFYNCVLKKEPRVKFDSVYLGPKFETSHIEQFLKKQNIPYQKLSDHELISKIASYLSEEKVVGWFQGRMELGPRALGNRSILADPRDPKMKDTLNEKIKHREAFRPFAPTVLFEKTHEYFDLPVESPYMLLVSDVKKEKQEKIPAVTHVNGTARVQTLRRDQNPRYYDLIKEFEKLTGVPVIVNTSFNVRGEPIVCTPEEAYQCFINTDMDILVLENCVVKKEMA